MEFNRCILVKRSTDLNAVKVAEQRQQMTLHCRQCNTILGDSCGICGEIMDSVMCLRVTDDVIVSDVMQPGHKGELRSCIYSSLKCQACGCAVGKVIHSAPSHLAAVRSIFLLHKANISCYILSSSSVVKASTLSFNLKPLKENIHEVGQQLEVLLETLMLRESRITDTSVNSELSK
ncbi:protein Mis18-beta [Parambassis ranga]|uniref:Protein Mis18-beta n=1 Tax=Parambassis ranga TaxID=210632 RepID=A0A6P7HI70_9TELE|nr:protein Mis18-beta [Parambassis ranga]